MKRTGRKGADERLLLALACGATVESAARQAGISESTVYRRLVDDEFKQRLLAMRAEMVQRTACTLTAAGTEAVKALLGLLQPATPHSTRLGAARAVLELGVKLREAAELEARIAALEAKAEVTHRTKGAPS
jgi:hypothetical protein